LGAATTPKSRKLTLMADADRATRKSGAPAAMRVRFLE
jgi:hypothetical protein